MPLRADRSRALPRRPAPRSTFARWHRSVGAGLKRWPAWGERVAILATLALLGAASLQVVRGWAAERAAARRALRAEMERSARAFGDAVVTATNYRHASLLGLDVARVPGAEPRRASELASRAERELALLGVPADARRGALVVTLGPSGIRRVDGEGLFETAGLARQVADTAYATHRDRPLNAGGVFSLLMQPEGVPLQVVVARVRDAEDATVALHAVAFSRAPWISPFARDVRRAIPLLPPSFLSVDWELAAAVGVERDGRQLYGVAANERRNMLLALRLETPDGRVLYEAPGREPVDWTGPYAGVATTGTTPWSLVARAALPTRHAERLARAAVPLGARQLTLASLLALGALFVTGAFHAGRRRRELADARAALVAVVSHEVRTPITHITALAETLLLGRAATPEQEQRWLRAIVRESTRLARLTENVLLHARGARGPLPLERRPTELGALVRDTLAVAQTLAAGRGAALAPAVPATPVVAVVDAGAVRQVLLNVVENALKYGPRGQTVRVALEPPTPTRGTALLHVDDEGPGIPATARARVWQPFVRFESVGGVAGGSGLGLSVVHELVQAHGGAAWIGDAPGGGARITIALPVSPGAATSTSTGTASTLTTVDAERT